MQGYQPTLNEVLATIDVTVANERDILIEPSPSWGADLQGALVSEAQKALAFTAPVSIARERVETLMAMHVKALVDLGAIVEGVDGLWHLEGTTIFKVQMPITSNEPEPQALVYNASRSSSAFIPVDEMLRDAMQGRLKAYFYGLNYDHVTDDECVEQLCQIDFNREAPEQDW